MLKVPAVYVKVLFQGILIQDLDAGKIIIDLFRHLGST